MQPAGCLTIQEWAAIELRSEPTAAEQMRDGIGVSGEDEIGALDHNELIIALVAAVGTDVGLIGAEVAIELSEYDYETIPLRVSEYLADEAGVDLFAEKMFDEAVWDAMSAGDELRQKWAVATRWHCTPSPTSTPPATNVPVSATTRPTTSTTTPPRPSCRHRLTVLPSCCGRSKRRTSSPRCAPSTGRGSSSSPPRRWTIGPSRFNAVATATARVRLRIGWRLMLQVEYPRAAREP